MPTTQLEPDEIVRRGQVLYEQRIRSQVEADHAGQFLVIDVLTGEYEVDADDVLASKRAKARFGDNPLFTLRVGHASAYRLGGRFRVPLP